MTDATKPAATAIPLLDLRPQYAPLRDQILAAVTRVCDSQRYIMGPEVAAFEREIAVLLGVPYAVAVSSGTDAVLLALMALGIKAGDEVITPAYSFFATAGAVARVGATPVFVDIDPVTFNVDPARVEAAITPRTKAIVPVHLFGLCADMAAVMRLADRHGIPVIEDAAQAIGARSDGKPAGSIGAFGCFSFFPSKNLGAFGDAGLVTTGDPALAHRAALLRNHGMEPRYYHHVVGANFRMDELQAAVLRVKAPHLDAWTEARRMNAQRYTRLFGEAGLSSHVTLPAEPPGCRHIFHQFVIRVAERDGLQAHLDRRQIGTAIYYPVPFHLQPCFAYLGYRRGDCPVAEQAADETLAIPIYSELTVEQQQTIVEAIGEFVNRTPPHRSAS
jgi:dTDP-4-amino-4,6-dideoxygalactose transaminase